MIMCTNNKQTGEITNKTFLGFLRHTSKNWCPWPWAGVRGHLALCTEQECLREAPGPGGQTLHFLEKQFCKRKRNIIHLSFVHPPKNMDIKKNSPLRFYIRSIRFFPILGISRPEAELGTRGLQPITLPSVHLRGTWPPLPWGI